MVEVKALMKCTVVKYEKYHASGALTLEMLL